MWNYVDTCENRKEKNCAILDIECTIFHKIIQDTEYFTNRGICPFYWEKGIPHPEPKEKIGSPIIFGECAYSCSVGNRWLGCSLFRDVGIKMGCGMFTTRSSFSVYCLGTHQECPFFIHQDLRIYHYPCHKCSEDAYCMRDRKGITDMCDGYQECDPTIIQTKKPTPEPKQKPKPIKKGKIVFGDW